MMPYLRFVPVGLLALLLGVRMFKPEFLATPIFDKVPFITWFMLVFVVLAYAAAWALSPGFIAFVNHMARIGLVPPVIVFGLLIAGIWAIDMAWNELVVPWCGPCGESHILASISNAISGGE